MFMQIQVQHIREIESITDTYKAQEESTQLQLVNMDTELHVNSFHQLLPMALLHCPRAKIGNHRKGDQEVLDFVIYSQPDIPTPADDHHHRITQKWLPGF